MRNTIFGRRGLPLALAAVLVVSLPATRPVWAAMSNTRELLTSELPAGVTLQRASVDQTAAAVHAAVKARPDLATDIVRVAIMAKMHGHGRRMDFKDGQAGDRYADPDFCDMVRRIVHAAITAAPDRANDITQMALSLAPGCADSLNSVTDVNDPSLTQGYNSPDDIYGGFGVGFGPGFPGSPGFTGSPPSGAIALPSATPVPVTSSVNG